MRNKIDTPVTIHFDEPLYRDIQDACVEEDRKFSEWVRMQMRMVIKLRKQGLALDKFVPSVGDATAEHEMRRDAQRISRR